jgi:hypothetical protein
MLTRDVAAVKPSVGRIVHYVSYGAPGGEYQSECRAAIITAVDEYQNPEGDEFIGHVDLCVLNPTGLFFNRGVHHRDADIETGSYRGGTWHWPERVE